MKDINTVGTWAMHGSTVKGFFLYLIWAIEFLMITGISALCCMIQSEAPFSEEKLEWFKASKLNEMAFITDKAGFIKTLESGNEEDFKKYLQKRGEMKSHAYISLYTMVGVDKHYIDVSNYKYKGVKEEYTAVPVISKVEIPYSFKKIIISTLDEKNKK